MGADTIPASERYAVTDLPDEPALFDVVGDARFVLLGEASHGTHDFYGMRAAITQRLIEEGGFSAVAVEADWPDTYRVDRFVRGRSDDDNEVEALGDFVRFPTWMWRNTVVRDFIAWLREHNERASDEQVGFYGLDLYSLHRSIDEVIAYLERVAPDAAQRARERYSCFDHVDKSSGSPDNYTPGFGAGRSCEDAAVAQMGELQRHSLEIARRDGLPAEDEAFSAEQNARTVREAEKYYRTMFRGDMSSWNLRDRHMADALEVLSDHLGRHTAEAPRIVVWAHNSHLGDARATEMTRRGELNLGQLVRQEHPNDSVLIGFTTYGGTVTAADTWGGPAKQKQVTPALPGSVEDLFHRSGDDRFMVRTDHPATAAALKPELLERAIGVIYRPETERQSHYFLARVADQFDAVIHIDDTHALEPLERAPIEEEAEVPATFPEAV